MRGSEPDSCKRGPSGKAQRVFSALLPHRPSPRRPHASSVAKFPGFPVRRAHWSIAGSSTRRRRRPGRRSPAPSGDRWMGAGWILWSRRKHCDAGRRATGESDLAKSDWRRVRRPTPVRSFHSHSSLLPLPLPLLPLKLRPAYSYSSLPLVLNSHPYSTPIPTQLSSLLTSPTPPRRTTERRIAAAGRPPSS